MWASESSLQAVRKWDWVGRPEGASPEAPRPRDGMKGTALPDERGSMVMLNWLPAPLSSHDSPRAGKIPGQCNKSATESGVL